MAIYRQVHISFWSDPFIEDLTPEEKYFFLYLMTNPKTTQCGIYEISKKTISKDTGIEIETVDNLISKFIQSKKILYDESTKEIFLLNWLKHNSIKSPKVKSCVKKELQFIKNNQYVKLFNTLCIQYGYCIDTVFKTKDTVSIDYGEEKEQEEEQEQEEEKEQEQEEIKQREGEIFKFFKKNISAIIAPFQSEMISSYLSDGMEPELILEILKDSVGKIDPWTWIKKVLSNSFERQIKTLAEYNDHKEKAKKAMQEKKGRDSPTDNRTNFEQRKYDKGYFDNLFEDI